MTIESCVHNQGRMGMCSACYAAMDARVEAERRAIAEHGELERAAAVAERHGLFEAARQLRSKAAKR